MSSLPARAPEVSVIIPSYKRVASIGASIASALNQTLTDIEVIVIDDASGDGTAELVAAIDDPRVVLVRHETNKGGNAARATGIARATGRRVAFLDSDDEWMPDKLAKQVALLDAKGAGYGLCTTWLSVFDSAGTHLFDVEPQLDGDGSADLLCRNVLGSFSSAMIDRETLLAAGSVDVSLPACQDWDVFSRVSRLTKVCVVPEHLVRYLSDPDDPVRITTSNARVVAGLRHMYGRFTAHRDQLTADQQRSGARYFAETFANEGSLGDVWCVVRDAMSARHARDARFGAHMLARSIRRIVRAAADAQRQAAESSRQADAAIARL